MGSQRAGDAAGRDSVASPLESLAERRGCRALHGLRGRNRARGNRAGAGGLLPVPSGPQDTPSSRGAAVKAARRARGPVEELAVLPGTGHASASAPVFRRGHTAGRNPRGTRVAAGSASLERARPQAGPTAEPGPGLV